MQWAASNQRFRQADIVCDAVVQVERLPVVRGCPARVGGAECQNAHLGHARSSTAAGTGDSGGYGGATGTATGDG
jgi:hypothetical protein